MTDTLPDDWPQLWRVMDRSCRKWFDMEYLDCSHAQVQFALKQDLAEYEAIVASAKAMLDRCDAANRELVVCRGQGFACIYAMAVLEDADGDPLFHPDGRPQYDYGSVRVIHQWPCPGAAVAS